VRLGFLVVVYLHRESITAYCRTYVDQLNQSLRLTSTGLTPRVPRMRACVGLYSGGTSLLFRFASVWHQLFSPSKEQSYSPPARPLRYPGPRGYPHRPGILYSISVVELRVLWPTSTFSANSIYKFPSRKHCCLQPVH
jgi:hypothetical protein